MLLSDSYKLFSFDRYFTKNYYTAYICERYWKSAVMVYSVSLVRRYSDKN